MCAVWVSWCKALLGCCWSGRYGARGIARALGNVARAYGMSKIAKEAGLGRESLYKALSEDGNPSLDTVVRVARAVGMRFKLAEA